MRGPGSLAVVFFHLSFAGSFAPQGYLAVDFFFLMSGAVVERAYRTRLERGMTTLDFMIERVVRFYPLYALGLLFGFMRRAAQIMVGHPNEMTWPDLVGSAVFNAVMLPSPFAQQFTPVNGPSWSLQFELLINLVWAVFLIGMSRRALSAFVAVAAFALCVATVHHGTAEGGWAWQHIYLGMARSFFGFGMGALMARVLPRRPPRASWLAVVALVFLCVLFVIDIAPEQRIAYDLFAIFVCLPVVLCIALSFDPPDGLRRIAPYLGDMSFPIYALHFGALFSFSYVARRLNIGPEIWIPVFIVGLCVVSVVLSRTYDSAARSHVRRWLSKRRAKQAASV
jgi:peptidoglycan/LPS O-acetylase OafA/YrhL